MDTTQLALLCAGFFAAASLYASVGHGGASAYLAIMALVSISPEIMRPTALTLNILVAALGAHRFIRAGRFSAAVFWPVALGAAPFAFLGGAIHLPVDVYRPLLGAVLLFAALRLGWPDPAGEARTHRPPRFAVGLGAGAAIGLLAGLTGTGGGIFLSPLVVFLRWTSVQASAGVAALFIVVNSLAGLAGNWASLGRLPSYLPLLVVAVGAGALFGVWLGAARFSPRVTRTALALVMVIAGLKLLLT